MQQVSQPVSVCILLVCINLCPYVGGMSLVSHSFVYFVCTSMFPMPLVCYPSLLIIVEWNPVNTDTIGAFQSVLTIGLSALSGLSDKKSRTHVLSIHRLRQTFLRKQNFVVLIVL